MIKTARTTKTHSPEFNERKTGMSNDITEQMTGTEECGLMGVDRAVQSGRREEMKHPPQAWIEPDYADLPLERLRSEYIEYLKGRSEATATGTIAKYSEVLTSFGRSLVAHGEAVTLDSLTPFAVNRWVAKQRAAGRSEHGIANRLSALKVFSKKYVCEYLELTTYDLLRKVRRLTPPDKLKPVLNETELKALLDSYEDNTYEDLRNRAFLAVLMATGLRFREALDLVMEDMDKISGELTVLGKGRRMRIVRLSPKAMHYLREYLRIRPQSQVSNRVWLTDRGKPLAYWGGQSVFRRLRQRTGIPRFHAHLLRHTFTQEALRRGAERAVVQDMLGHATEAMTRRYAGEVRQQIAATMMPKFSPL